MWQRPPRDILKINWDASLDSTNQKIGIGVVIKNYKGQVLGTFRVATLFNSNPFVPESIALLMAIQLCRDLGLHSIQIEGDALQVVRLLEHNDPDWSDGGLLIQDAFQLLNSFANWSIHHVY